MPRSGTARGVLVCVTVGLALLGPACATTTEEPQVTPADGTTTQPTVEESAAAAAGVGDTLTLEGTSYTVTDAVTAKKVGEEFTEVEADGVFVIVKLTLENQKDEPATIVEDLVRLQGGNGKEYTTDFDAAIAFDNPLLLAEEIQPELAKKVVAVYDVPKKAVKGAKLLVKDFWTDSTGEIDLGL